MAGIILNGSVIKGLILNGSPVTAILDGVKVFPTEAPGPTATLLYEQAVQNYFTQDGMVTIMSGRTWNTNKNFICYKINLKINGDTLGNGYGHDRGVFVKQPYGEYDLSMIKCGRLVAEDLNGGTYAPKNTSFIQCSNIGTATVQTAGRQFIGDWNNTNTFRAEPNVITTDAVTYKYVFDIAQHKAYCYIGNVLVCVIDFGTYTPYTWDLSTEYGAASPSWGDPCALDADCGIQVYACDSLEAAEAL